MTTQSNPNFFRATGAVAIASTIEPEIPWELVEVRLHLSAVGGSGDFTVTLDSAAGAVYDVNLLTTDLTSLTDLVWQPNDPILLAPDDAIDIAWANAGTKTYGLEVVWRGR